MSRKYKSKGYMEDDDDRQKSRRKQSGPFVKGRVETSYKRTIRCVECSSSVQFIDELGTTDTCKNCDADLHTCRNCKFFDPGLPNECMQPIETRIEKKSTRNLCTRFKPKVLIEKAVEGKKEKKTNNARQAFDDLFKI